MKTISILLFAFVCVFSSIKSTKAESKTKGSIKYMGVKCDTIIEESVGYLIKKESLIVDNYHITYSFREMSDTIFASTCFSGDTISYRYVDRYAIVSIYNEKRDCLINKKITKHFFNSIISSETINEYKLTSFKFNGVKKGQISFNFGIYIPDTDIGYSIDVNIFPKGDVILSERQVEEEGDL